MIRNHLLIALLGSIITLFSLAAQMPGVGMVLLSVGAALIAGVLLIGVLGSALRLANVTSDVINIITGVLLIGAVISTSVIAAIKNRRRTGKKLQLAGARAATDS